VLPLPQRQSAQARGIALRSRHADYLMREPGLEPGNLAVLDPKSSDMVRSSDTNRHHARNHNQLALRFVGLSAR
jgi:hypothetical protein